MFFIVSKDIVWASGLNFDEKEVIFNLEQDFSENDVIVVDGDSFSPETLLSVLLERKLKNTIYYKANTNINFYHSLSLFKDFAQVKVYADSLSLPRFSSIVMNDYKKEFSNNSNVICFSGASRGVGCTSVSSSISKMIANDETVRVLHIALDGTEGFEYLIGKTDYGIDSIKSKLLTGIVTETEIFEVCTKITDNLFFLKGSSRVPFVRQFTPESIELLLDKVSPKFDVVICDLGSDYTLGSSVGALGYTKHRFLVTGQNPVPIRRFRNSLYQVLSPLGFSEFYTIINNYRDIDGFLTPTEISTELNTPITAKIPHIPNAIQCEVKNQTLSELFQKETGSELNKVIGIISEIIGRKINVSVKRKNSWFGGKN